MYHREGMLQVERSPITSLPTRQLGSITVDIPRDATIVDVVLRSDSLSWFATFCLGVTYMWSTLSGAEDVEREWFVAGCLADIPDNAEFCCFCENDRSYFLYKRKEGNEPRKDAE